jgi:two-component system, OmpR family, phosphate regulon response regulator PhoB
VSATVLIVEDESDITLTIRLLLQNEGYEVFGVTTGEAALDIFADDPPDVTVLDVVLPGMDGLEVARRLREDPRNQATPIVITSAHASVQVRRCADALGCRYLTKPFGTAELATTIAELLALRDHGVAAPIE